MVKFMAPESQDDFPQDMQSWIDAMETNLNKMEANLEEKANAAIRETPKEFFESLPQELQIAARYVADGGTDLKGLFGATTSIFRRCVRIAPSKYLEEK